MGSGTNTLVDESISTRVDPLGEEARTLLSNAPFIVCLHCGAGNSGFRLGS
jgi:hypothetical protein